MIGLSGLDGGVPEDRSSVCYLQPQSHRRSGDMFFFSRWKAQNSAQDSYTQSKVVLTNGEEGELCRDKSLASKARIVIAALESSSC